MWEPWTGRTGETFSVTDKWIGLEPGRVYGIETTTDLEIAAPPEELAAVEVYSDHATVPGQFDGGIACGAIVMWTLPADLWGHGGH